MSSTSFLDHSVLWSPTEEGFLMNGRRALWLTTLALAFGLGTAVGQQAPPTENKGFTTGSTTMIDLGPEIDGMQGRQLRPARLNPRAGRGCRRSQP
jgi:hypothetical protein